MGFRVLLLLAVFATIFMAVRRLARRRRQIPPRGAAAEAEDMVRCEICGVHVPRSRSLEQAGHHFCSSQHLREFRPRP